MALYTIWFEPIHKKVKIDPGDAPFSGTGEPGSILDIAVDNDIAIEHDCGGMGGCGTCVVTIEDGADNLSEATDDELALLEGEPVSDDEIRLACQAVVQGDVVVRISAAE